MDLDKNNLQHQNFLKLLLGLCNFLVLMGVSPENDVSKPPMKKIFKIIQSKCTNISFELDDEIIIHEIIAPQEKLYGDEI